MEIRFFSRFLSLSFFSYFFFKSQISGLGIDNDGNEKKGSRRKLSHYYRTLSFAVPFFFSHSGKKKAADFIPLLTSTFTWEGVGKEELLLS